MRFSRTISGLVGLGAFLAGCAEQPTSVPELQPVGGSVLDNRVIQSARGSGNLTVAGELRTFTFHAQRSADGSVSGEFQIIARQVDRVSHGRITCMQIFGNSAWLGGII